MGQLSLVHPFLLLPQNAPYYDSLKTLLPSADHIPACIEAEFLQISFGPDKTAT
jgi:hypothetical protein